MKGLGHHKKGLTQEELAKIAKISRTTLSKLEKGEFGNVSVAVLDAILAALRYELCIEVANIFLESGREYM